MGLLTERDVEFVTRRWIGVHMGYLGDFSYRTHDEFYPDYCGIEHIRPNTMDGTTRQRFEKILLTESPAHQALILKGVLKRFPTAHDLARTSAHLERMKELIARCEGGTSVEPVTPTVGRAVVEQALLEAEHRLKAGAPLGAVDRVHTAFHGYLVGVAAVRGVALPKDAPTTKVFKLLRSSCPELRPVGPHGDQFEKILNSIASIVDAANPLRSHGTLAHPNEHLIEPAEAILYVNALKTLMHYLNAKLASVAPSSSQPPSSKPAQEESTADENIPF